MTPSHSTHPMRIAITIASVLLALALAPSRDLVLPLAALAAGLVLLWTGSIAGLRLAALASITILILHFSSGSATMLIVIAALTLNFPATAPRGALAEPAWRIIAYAAALAAIAAPTASLGTALLGVTLLSLGAQSSARATLRAGGGVMLMAVAPHIATHIPTGANPSLAALLWLIGATGYALITLEAGPRAALAPVAALALLWRWHPPGGSAALDAAFGLILVLSALMLFALRPRGGQHSPWSYLAMAQIGIIVAGAGLDHAWPEFCLPVGFALTQIWRARAPDQAWALLALAGFPPFALFVGDVITLQAVRVQQSGMAIMMAIGWLTMAMIALIRLRGVRQ
ncbi:MAG: hypothetical protein ACP5M1_09710 [Acidiphilium sp.]